MEKVLSAVEEPVSVTADVVSVIIEAGLQAAEILLKVVWVVWAKADCEFGIV